MVASVAAGTGRGPRLSFLLNPAGPGGRMLLVLEMDVADLAATRFAISPLCETLKAVQLLARPDPPPGNRPWIRWARGPLDRRAVAGQRHGPVRAAAGVLRGDSRRTRRMPRPAHRPALGADQVRARRRRRLPRGPAGRRRGPVAVRRPARRPALVRGQALPG